MLAASLTTVMQASPWQDSLPRVSFRVGQLAGSQARGKHPLGAKSPVKGTAGTWGPTSSGFCPREVKGQWRQIEEQARPMAVELRLDQDGSLKRWLKEGSDKLGCGRSGWEGSQALKKTAHVV